MKVFVVIDAEMGTAVWYNRENAEKNTLMFFASMDIEVKLEGDDFMGEDNTRWATIKECEIGDS